MVYWQRNMSEWFNINLQYLFVHMSVYNKQFIIHCARYEHKIHVAYFAHCHYTKTKMTALRYTKLCYIEI